MKPYWDVNQVDARHAKMDLMWRGVHAWTFLPLRHREDRRYLAICLGDLRREVKRVNRQEP